jgi:hypothetical protein
MAARWKYRGPRGTRSALPSQFDNGTSAEGTFRPAKKRKRRDDSTSPTAARQRGTAEGLTSPDSRVSD